MIQNKKLYIYIGIPLLILLASCSNKKNTAVSRAYHSINTRYNIHFNANEAYKEAYQQKLETQEDNLSELIYIYPYDPDAMDKILNDSLGTSFGNSSNSQDEKKGGLLSSLSSSLFDGGGGGGQNSSGYSSSSPYNTASSSFGGGGSFTTAIDKSTKAIRLHSITTKPRRDRQKMQDPKYREWVQQKEFNPFMRHVWLLLGKSELQNGNYLRAISTFMYITKIYPDNVEILAECQLWIACAYTEMGWMYEAGDILAKLDRKGEVPESLGGLYSSVYANYLMRSEEFDEAIPYLQTAIKKEKNSYQKLRMKYMLGQLYEKVRDNSNAYRAYGKVQGLETPYKFSVNARLSQLAIDNTRPVRKVISDLEKMGKTSKNENYLDKIYYTLGNVYLQQQDTTSAVASYHQAIKKGGSGYDKTLAQIRLGDLYFDLKQFIPAQPFYSEALPSLKKTDKDYPRISKRSAVLDELVIHAKIVKEQDSLQYVAKLPEAERMQLIQEKIAQLKEEEKKRKKEEEYEQRMEQREQQISSWDDLDNMIEFDQLNSTNTTRLPNLSQQQSDAKFYFYNPQTVEQGKAAFRKQWGTRKLEDNWRRRNKTTSGFDDSYDNFAEIEQDTTQIQTPDNVPVRGGWDDEGEPSLAQFQQPQAGQSAEEQDIYNPDYYLQQLPLTPEALKQSDELIEDGLFHMGGIYKDKLEDNQLAIDAYETDLRRFPETPNAEEIYYQLFLIYMQLDNREMMAYYRSKLLTEYPDKKYAIALSDPDYEWNLKHMHALQDSLYMATYDAYLDSDIYTVRTNYESLQRKYPFADLMPKFMLLNSLTYAQQRDASGLKAGLEKLVQEYPDADVTPMAQDILGHIREGRILLSDGMPIRGMDWNIPYEGEEGEGIVDINQVQFADNIDSPHILLLFYKSNTVDRNELLYQVADYNFTNYIVQTFDLNFEQDPPIEMLQISGFEKYANIRSYINRAFLPEGLAHKLDPSILMIPVSVENSRLLLRKGIDEYIAFYQEHYVNQTPQLVAYWNGERSLIDSYIDEDLLAQELEQETSRTNTVTTEPEISSPVRQSEHQQVEREDIQSSLQRQQEEQARQAEKEQQNANNTQIKGSDIFSQDQLDIISSAGEIVDNPVDGLKGLFSKYKDSKKLTKEEKEALKEEQRRQKERDKELKAIEKLHQDSLARIEKAVQDSIKQVERAKIEEQKRVEAEKNRIEKEKIEAQKAKEREREAARKQKEQEREQKRRETEERRKNLEKERDERRKAQQREQEEKRKAQERARKEKERQAQERRKNR